MTNTSRLKPTLQTEARATTRGRGERGYALLMVFLMAAIVGLYLYTQLPRVAFESERDKEQTLIDRGEQYVRAIQLYVKALNKYPQKIEDLENTNDKRYLRRRYIDPMTGKDGWRLIHVNAAGQLTDSLVQPPPCGALTPGAGGTAPSGASSTTGSSTAAPSTAASSTTGSSSSTAPGSTPGTNGSPGCAATPSGTTGTGSNASSGTATTATTAAGTNGAGGTTPTDPNDVNAAVRRRPSDVVGQAYSAPAAADPNDPSTWGPITLAAPGAANGQPPSAATGFNGGLLGQPTGQVPGQVGANGQVGVPGQNGVGFPLPGQPGFNPTQNQFKIDANGQLVPVTPPQPGQANPAQTGQTNPGQTGPTAQPYVQPPTPGQPVAPSPFGAQAGAAAPNGAVASINQQLTNPAAPQGLGTSAGMTTGGIAGVASMYKGPSIKIYGTRQKYQEWEFIFSQNSQQNIPKAQNPLGTPGSTTGQSGTGTGSGAGTSTSPGTSTTGN